MYSILGRGSFCFNYCLNSAWHGGDQFVALLRWYGSPGSLTVAFSSSALLGLVSLIFLLTIPHRFSMGFRSGEFAGQSSTVTPWSLNQLLVPLAVWGRCQVLLENEISHKACQQKEAWSALKFPGRWLRWLWTQKTQWTNTSRWHGSPNHHRLWKLHTGLQATWILCLSTLPPDSGTLFPNEMQNVLSSEKRTLDHWVIFLHSPGKTLLVLSPVQKWLGSPFPEDVWAWWLLMHWLQLQSTPCEALTSVWISFAWQYSQASNHPCCLCTFSYPNSSFQSTLHSICFDTALCKQPHLSVMTLCDLPSLWRASMFVFWIIANSAVFSIIVVSKNKRYP